MRIEPTFCSHRRGRVHRAWWCRHAALRVPSRTASAALRRASRPTGSISSSSSRSRVTAGFAGRPVAPAFGTPLLPAATRRLEVGEEVLVRLQRSTSGLPLPRPMMIRRPNFNGVPNEALTPPGATTSSYERSDLESGVAGLRRIAIRGRARSGTDPERSLDLNIGGRARASTRGPSGAGDATLPPRARGRRRLVSVCSDGRPGGATPPSQTPRAASRA